MDIAVFDKTIGRRGKSRAGKFSLLLANDDSNRTLRKSDGPH
jgi:hypothetical protein